MSGEAAIVIERPSPPRDDPPAPPTGGDHPPTAETLGEYRATADFPLERPVGPSKSATQFVACLKRWVTVNRALVLCVLCLPLVAVLSTIAPFVTVFLIFNKGEVESRASILASKARQFVVDELTLTKTSSKGLQGHWNHGLLACDSFGTIPDLHYFIEHVNLFDNTFSSFIFADFEGMNSTYIGVSRKVVPAEDTEGDTEDTVTLTYALQYKTASLDYRPILNYQWYDNGTSSVDLGSITKSLPDFLVGKRPYYQINETDDIEGFWGTPYTSQGARGDILSAYHILALTYRGTDTKVGLVKNNLSLDRISAVLRTFELQSESFLLVVESSGFIVGSSSLFVGLFRDKIDPLDEEEDPVRNSIFALDESLVPGISEYLKEKFPNEVITIDPDDVEGGDGGVLVQHMESGSYYFSLAPINLDNLDWIVLVFQPKSHVTASLVESLAGILGSTLGLFVLFVLVTISVSAVCFVLVRRLDTKLDVQREALRKFQELEDFETVLQEQKAEQRAGMDKIKVDRSLFAIEYSDVRLVRHIGSGGSGANIYLARWQQKEVAFKVFRFRASTQSALKEFEREFSIALSVRHPHILTVFGACVKGRRLGIVMEYCSNGPLSEYLILMRASEGSTFHFKDKLKMLSDIGSAVEYLHKKSIIHRDLKLENILLTTTLSTRLIDFGLSRLVGDKDSFQRLTSNLGTSYYMAPEIVLGTVYDFKVDVYSFSIIMCEMFMESDNPYGVDNDGKSSREVGGIELQVARDPTFRPRVTEFAISRALADFDGDVQWYVDLMRRGWSANAVDRPSMAEVVHEIREQFEKSESESDLRDSNQSRGRVSRDRVSRERTSGDRKDPEYFRRRESLLDRFDRSSRGDDESAGNELLESRIEELENCLRLERELREGLEEKIEQMQKQQ